jgi:hypothetical protein
VVSGLVEAARFNWVYQAELARTFLESHGVHAVVFDSGLNIAEGGGLATAVRLMVLDEQRDEALDLLADYRP